MWLHLSRLTLIPSLLNSGSQYSATLSKLLGSEMEYTRQMTCARVSWDKRCARDLGLAGGYQLVGLIGRNAVTYRKCPRSRSSRSLG
jgi:hypothetical protein